MLHRVQRLIAGVSLLLLALGSAEARVHQVIVTTFEYIPADLTVAVGDSVRWVWDMGTHTITQGTDCTLPPQPLFREFSDPTHPVFTFRFTTPGVVDYYCEPHCLFQDMKAKVRVLAASEVPSLEGQGLKVDAPTPNPSRAGTMLRFELPRPSAARLSVQDASGRVVRVIELGRLDVGAHWAEWDGRDAAGTSVAAGVYFVRLHAAGTSATRSVVCLR